MRSQPIASVNLFSGSGAEKNEEQNELPSILRGAETTETPEPEIAMVHRIQKEFDSFVDAFVEEYLATHPEAATGYGVHEYDDQLSDLTWHGIERDVRRLRRAETQLKKLERKLGPRGLQGLPPAFRLDFRILKATIESARFDLEELRPWERDPSYYNDLLFQSLFMVMKRNYAPLEKRVAAIVGRVEQIPRFLSAAKINLKHTPRLVAQLAVTQCRGTIQFLKNTLPPVVLKIKDLRLRSRFHEANTGAILAYSQFIDWLEEKVIPGGSKKFGIGEQKYQRKLWVDERVDVPLENLLQRGYESLAEHEDQFRRVATQINPSAGWHEVLQKMTEQHPRTDEVISSTSQVLDQLRHFLSDRHIISLPPPSRGVDGKPLCIVDESPEFLRELTFASLDVPGPLEKRSKEFYYYVTLPDPRWTPDQQEQHLRFFSKHLILTTSIHEAFPGHLVHFLWINRQPSKVRRLFGATSHVEGWAHYCEQMMVDEGFGDGDPHLRLAQLHEAQLRLCRFIVGIEMHARGMTFQRGKNFFVRHAHMEPINAEREAKRGIVDPTYLVYTLGKMQFLRLREDLKKAQGPRFSLEKFHNACVQNGYPPIPFLREYLLGEQKALI